MDLVDKGLRRRRKVCSVHFTHQRKEFKLTGEVLDMNCNFQCYASAAFGMESLVARELKRLPYISDASAENGGVRFRTDGSGLFLANLSMHFSDRLYLILGEKKCTSFDHLFHMVYDIDWMLYFSGSESIDVSCKCTRSTLMSPRDCQSITKKAIIEKLRNSTGQKNFPETGASLMVHISVRYDTVMILLNASGDALSRRGYRTWNGEAPIRETLAAALVELSGWHPGQPLHDPCCGTGTILAEAALIASGTAPGLKRSFSMEKYKCFSDLNFTALRSLLADQSDPGKIIHISGSDINPDALELARRHFSQAGFSEHQIPLEQIPLQDLSVNTSDGVFICNPPYGERLSDQKQCRALYHELFMLKKRHPTWRLCAISSDPAFERSFGKRADKKRRLYNGRLECVYYIYY